MIDWSLESDVAVGRLGLGELLFDPQRPTAGLSLRWAGHELQNVFSLQCDPRHAFVVEELYRRNQDLIVRYKQSPQDQFSLQFDWCCLENAVADGCELRVSIATTLLDSAPSLRLILNPHVRWTAYRLEQLIDNPKAVMDPPGLDASVIAAGVGDFGGRAVSMLVSPRDLSQVSIQSDSEGRATDVRVFGTFLEKGVIRRGRMRFHLHTQVPQVADLKPLYAHLLASPLPLTA